MYFLSSDLDLGLEPPAVVSASCCVTGVIFLVTQSNLLSIFSHPSDGRAGIATGGTVQHHSHPFRSKGVGATEVVADVRRNWRKDKIAKTLFEISRH